MGCRCVNAARDLPPEVFAALTAALGHRPAHVWVPGPGSSTRNRRDAYVLRLTQEGHTAGSVAARVFISERTVRRILAKARGLEKRRPSHPEPVGRAPGDAGDGRAEAPPRGGEE